MGIHWMTLVRSNEDEEYSIGVVTYCIHCRSMMNNLYFKVVSTSVSNLTFNAACLIWPAALSPAMFASFGAPVPHLRTYFGVGKLRNR